MANDLFVLVVWLITVVVFTGFFFAIHTWSNLVPEFKLRAVVFAGAKSNMEQIISFLEYGRQTLLQIVTVGTNMYIL